VIEEIFEKVESAIEGMIGKKFYGVVTGTVINPVDPQGLGRVQVRLPFIDSLDLSPWARVAVPMAGMFYGSYFIPNPGDQVLVAYECRENIPYIIGSLWTMVARPPLPSPLPQIRVIRTPIGNQIVFEEVPPSITLQTGPTPPVPIPSPPSPVGPFQTIKLSPTGATVMASNITLQAGASSIQITPAGITLQSGSNIVSITPEGVEILATKVDVTGMSSVEILGAMVKIN
jgi:hypothetical protein